MQKIIELFKRYKPKKFKHDKFISKYSTKFQPLIADKNSLKSMKHFTGNYTSELEDLFLSKCKSEFTKINYRRNKFVLNIFEFSSKNNEFVNFCITNNYVEILSSITKHDNMEVIFFSSGKIDKDEIFNLLVSHNIKLDISNELIQELRKVMLTKKKATYEISIIDGVIHQHYMFDN